ncbi:MAG: LpqN/LpqT family lipoprotein [Mycobacterium sp.]
MKSLTSVAGAGITALAVSLALVGCGSDSSTEADNSTVTASAEGETSTTERPEPAPPASPDETIQDYIVKNGLRESSVSPGDAGSPTVNLPVPPGWQRRDDLPEAPYGAFFYPTSAVPANPPRILVLMSELTGDVDPNDLLQYAPGELRGMPGFVPTNEGSRSQLMGFESAQVAGTYLAGGRNGVVAQNTIVIPADDGAFVLQLNAYADETEAGIVSQGIQAFDQQMAIIP